MSHDSFLIVIIIIILFKKKEFLEGKLKSIEWIALQLEFTMKKLNLLQVTTQLVRAGKVMLSL